MKTIKKLLLIILSLSFTFNVLGQNDDNSSSKKIKFSPEVGLTIANQKTESDFDGEDRKSILGFLAGVGINFPLNEKIAVDSGVFFAQKGSKSGGSDYEDKLKMLYIDVPILAKVNLGENGFAIFGGVQPSFLLNAKQESSGPNINNDSETVTDQFEKFDLAAVLGLGYLFGNGISLHTSYDLGLLDISKGDDEFDYFDTKNRVFKFSIGYVIDKEN